MELRPRLVTVLSLTYDFCLWGVPAYSETGSLSDEKTQSKTRVSLLASLLASLLSHGSLRTSPAPERLTVEEL